MPIEIEPLHALAKTRAMNHAEANDYYGFIDGFKAGYREAQLGSTEMPTMVFQPRVGCAVIVRANDLILVSERIGCRDMNGLWHFPGGAIEVTESVYGAARRELREETGLCCIKEFKCLGTGVGKTPDRHVHVTTFFLVEYGNEVPCIENKEVEKHGPWAWVSIENLLKMPIIELMRPFLIDLAGK